MIYALVLVAAFVLTVWLYMKLPQFGAQPAGVRLARMSQSANYRNGAFQNLSETPQFTNGGTFVKASRKFFFGQSPRKQPAAPLSPTRTNLHELDPNEDCIVWFGHSSYYMQVGGKRILVDPVFSGHASPISTSTRSFNGTEVYTAADFPEIDYLFITHDHYDHLDFKTVKALRPKVKRVITALGVGAHLEKWGYDTLSITERDWWETIALEPGFTVHTAPSRHFSGRTFRRNVTLWTSFVLEANGRRIYIGGDSGYDSHFKAVGEKYGPFDIAILECGQYNEYWQNIHMMPEETVQAARDLQAAVLFPVHWSKFALSLHDWDEPITRVTAEAARLNQPLIHPPIGTVVALSRLHQHNTAWWQQHR